MTPAPGLDDRDLQAIALARDLRHCLAAVLARRGILTAILRVSPFIDTAGQPSVLIRLNADAGRALVSELHQPTTPGRPEPPS